MSDKQKRVMSHKERQKFLKTSGLAEIFGVGHLLPEVEDWDYYISSPPLSPKNIIEVEIEQVKSIEPLSYTP